MCKRVWENMLNKGNVSYTKTFSPSPPSPYTLTHSSICRSNTLHCCSWTWKRVPVALCLPQFKSNYKCWHSNSGIPYFMPRSNNIHWANKGRMNICLERKDSFSGNFLGEGQKIYMSLFWGYCFSDWYHFPEKRL